MECFLNVMVTAAYLEGMMGNIYILTVNAYDVTVQGTSVMVGYVMRVMIRYVSVLVNDFITVMQDILIVR